ncbi:MAG: SDR family oxidoreductase [Actinomycetia bacterium]|nr:SDR family oxidoreductase [Actinomycetes bacterium]
MDLALAGRKAVVTGASRGIGRAIAEGLAREGVDLAICARGVDGLERARNELAAHGVAVFARQVDVSDGEALRAFVSSAGDELAGLDILVSNPTGAIGADEDAWRSMFEADLMAAVRSSAAARPFLAASDAASVVFISTIAAIETFAGPVSYGPLKAGTIQYAKELSREAASEGIRVNAVSPGPIFFEGGPWDRYRRELPERYEQTLAQCPQGRFGTPEEVSNAVVFLSSSAASLITGINLVVDGGFTKRVF